MKPKPINSNNKVDLQETMAFFDLLSVKFSIKSAEESAQTCDNILSEFCGKCDSHGDDCECNQDRGGRYMPEYDDGADYED